MSATPVAGETQEQADARAAALANLQRQQELAAERAAKGLDTGGYIPSEQEVEAARQKLGITGEPKLPEPEIVSPTSSPDKFLVNIPQDGTKKTQLMTREQIASMGLSIPEQIEREVQIGQTYRTQRFQASREKKAEFEAQDIAKQKAEQEEAEKLYESEWASALYGGRTIGGLVKSATDIAPVQQTGSRYYYVRGVFNPDGKTFTFAKPLTGQLISVNKDTYEKYEKWWQEFESHNAARQSLIDKNLATYVNGVFNTFVGEALKQGVSEQLLLNAGYTQDVIDKYKEQEEIQEQEPQVWENRRTGQTYTDTEYKTLVKEYNQKLLDYMTGDLSETEWEAFKERTGFVDNPNIIVALTREEALKKVAGFPERIFTSTQEALERNIPQSVVPEGIKNASIEDVVKYLDKSVEPTGSGFTRGISLSGDESALLTKVIIDSGIELQSGSGVATWRNLNDEQKREIAEKYQTSEAIPLLSQLAETATGAAVAIPTYSLLALPSLAATIAQSPTKTPEVMKNVAKALGQSYANVFYIVPKGVLSGGGIASPFHTGLDVGIVALTLKPVPKMAKGVVTSIEARVRPDVMPGSATALTPDVGRVVTPEGMSALTARQLIQDVMQEQLTGEIPINRLRSIKGLPKDGSLTITRTANGTPDIIIKTADGNVIGRVAGGQRVVNDIMYHATSDIESVLKEIRQNGFNEVLKTASETEKILLQDLKDQGFIDKGYTDFIKKPQYKDILQKVYENSYMEVKEGEKPYLFASPQTAQTFLFPRELGVEVKNPGIIAIRTMDTDFATTLPKSVLDNPLRDFPAEMNTLSREGKLGNKIYLLYKGYGKPTHLEYETVFPIGYKLYMADPTWYAPLKDAAPRTYATSMVNYTGLGKQVRVGDKIPVYWMGTKAAVDSGKGVLSLRNTYMAKILGDITTIRKYLPWNIRLRPKETIEGETAITTSNPLYSKIQQMELKAVAEDKGAGRVSAIIKDKNGRVLLTRTQGQMRYDLPGGGVLKKTLRHENLGKAMRREVWEELGLEAENLNHIDTLQSRFNPEGNIQKFQIFDVRAKGKIDKGAEIAEYKWWDGNSELDYPIAEFTREALERAKVRQNVIDNAVATEVYKDIADRVDARIKELKREKRLDKASEDVIRERLYKDALDELDPRRDIIKYRPETRDVNYVFPISQEDKAISEYEVKEEIPLRKEPDIFGITGEEVIGTKEEKELIETPVSEEPIKEIPPAEELIPTEEPPTELIPPEEPPEEPPTEETPPEIPPEQSPPIEEPPEQPPEEPPIPPPMPPETPKLVNVKDKDGKRQQVQILPGTVAWIQGRPYGGAMIKLVVPPYNQDSFYTTRELPPGFKDMGWEGEGSAKESLQILGGMPPNNIENLDLGWARININISGGKPEIEYLQDTDANVGERSKTVGYGRGQIPIEAWDEAKAEGQDYESFIQDYKGVLVGEDNRRNRIREIVYDESEMLQPNQRAWYENASLIKRRKVVKPAINAGQRYYLGHPVLPADLGGNI